MANNSFKPKLLRSGNGVAEKACHAATCATQFGLTQALGLNQKGDTVTSYTGLFVQKLSDGTIFSVQVTDPFGNSIPLEPDIYIEREIKPDIDKLPTSDEYAAQNPQRSA